MSYVVQALDYLYDEAPEDSVAQDVVGKFLSEHESAGYTLVGIVPDHRTWNSEGESAGITGSMLILHKPE